MREQAIALAGMWQALELVHQLAKDGEMDAPQRRRFSSSIDSLFVRTASSHEGAARVFGGMHQLEYALHGLAHHLEAAGKRNQLLVYMIQLLALQQRVAKNAGHVERIAKRLTELERQREFLSAGNNQLVANLADLYLETLGSLPMQHRIRIYGKGEHLKQENVHQSIRALLLAGLRAAMLWKQMGGNRLLLLLQRKRLLRELYGLIGS